jgi:hypothetical protein
MVLWVISYICTDMSRLIHYCTVVYFALIVLIRMMAMPISLIDYALNKNFIAANLCENRFKSEVHCAGTCYLGKQLARANENQNTQDHKGTVKILIIDFFEPVAQPSFGCNHVSAVQHFAVNSIQIRDHYRDNLFRPPIA